MNVLFRSRRTIALALVLVLAPLTVFAQEEPNRSLRVATIAAGAAAAADWASTYHTLKNYHTRETNPLLRPMDDTPGRLVTVGAILDVGAVTAWNLTMGKKHPKVAVAGLWAMTAFRVYLTVHNIRNQQKALPR